MLFKINVMFRMFRKNKQKIPFTRDRGYVICIHNNLASVIHRLLIAVKGVKLIMVIDRSTDHENSPAQKIYKELRNRICLRVYKNGEILKENEIAQEFSVSRTPVRESFQRLKLDGLIESKKKVGTVVKGIDDETIYELYEIRINLLDYVANESKEIYSENDIQKMENLLERVNKLSIQKDTAEYWKINDELFSILISVIQNKSLKQLIISLFLQTAKNWAFLLPQIWDRSCEILKQEIERELEFMKVGDKKGVIATWKCYVMASMQYCRSFAKEQLVNQGTQE